MKITIDAELIPAGNDAKLKDGGFLKIMPKEKHRPILIYGLRDLPTNEIRVIITDDVEKWSIQAIRLFHGLIRIWLASGDYDYWELINAVPDSFEWLKNYAKYTFGDAKIVKCGEQHDFESCLTFGKKRMSKMIDKLLNFLLNQKGLCLDREKLDWEGMK